MNLMAEKDVSGVTAQGADDPSVPERTAISFAHSRTAACQKLCRKSNQTRRVLPVGASIEPTSHPRSDRRQRLRRPHRSGAAEPTGEPRTRYTANANSLLERISAEAPMRYQWPTEGRPYSCHSNTACTVNELLG
jgi:hypothetical protein